MNTEKVMRIPRINPTHVIINYLNNHLQTKNEVSISRRELATATGLTTRSVSNVNEKLSNDPSWNVKRGGGENVTTYSRNPDTTDNN